MRLVIIDQDINYIKKFKEVVLSLKDTKYMFSIYSNLTEINKEDFKKEDIILIDEVFITELENKEEYKYLKKCNLVFLIEEKFKESVIRSIANILEYTILENINIKNIEYVKRFIINKYSSVNEILKEIKEKYIFNSKDLYISKKKDTKIICLYTPYSNIDTPKKIEKCLNVNKKSVLLIQTDSIYNDKKEINFSYILLSVKKKKNNIEKIIKSSANIFMEHLDVLSGPDNMRDLNCLNEEEIEYLKEVLLNSGYDFVIINLCGIQVTKNVYQIIKFADKNILCSNNEIIQKKVLEQLNIEWNVDNKGDLQVVRDIIEL